MQFVVHYAEIGLKGKNRPRFEAALRANLVRALGPLEPVRVKSLYGRILVELPEDADRGRAEERIAGVFGGGLLQRGQRM